MPADVSAWLKRCRPGGTVYVPKSWSRPISGPPKQRRRMIEALRRIRRELEEAGQSRGAALECLADACGCGPRHLRRVLQEKPKRLQAR